MKKSVSILLGVMLAAALLLCVAIQADAQGTRVEVASYEYDCFTGLEKDWLEGQVYHMRNVYHTNIDVSDAPELNGINTTVADADFNLKTGEITIRGTMSFQPYQIDGTWEGSWFYINNKGIVKGQAVAQGTGELSGKTLYLKIYDAPYNPDAEAMCEGIGLPEGNVVIEGYILDSGG